MIKKILITILLATPFFMKAQNYNPFVAQGIVSPAPLEDVASNGTGVVAFLVGNSGDDPLPLVTNQEMLLVITLSRGIPNNQNPLLAVGGTMASYFDWLYDPGTFSYLATQNQLIPDAFGGGIGTIEILYKVTSNSVEPNPQNGFNVNLTPPAYTNGVNSLNDDQVSSYTWTVQARKTQPDMNATFVDSTIIGSVHTNDSVPVGTTYGLPAPMSGNPAIATIVMQPNGTYTFTGPEIGVYHYLVPVCPSGQTTGCPNELLTITVTDPSVLTNPPTANVDKGTTYGQTPITLNTLGNDACNNPNCKLAPGSVSIITPPKFGNITIDPITGNTTYTANLGFYGVDTLTYQVCDSNAVPVKCVTSIQIITVLPPGGKNIIELNDDYKVIPKNTDAIGNAVTNDIDPEGDVITVTPQTTFIQGKGTLTLTSTGTYTFTPVTDYVGHVEFPYMACDDGTPQACAKATIYITINPQSIPLPVIFSKLNVTDENCKAKITWTTSREENVSHFDIEKLTNGVYTQIGKVQAVGTSSSPSNYSFLDELTIHGANTYRLHSVDIDGKSTYSNELTISINCLSNEISLYPNPANSSTNLLISTEDNEIFDIKVMDMLGNTLIVLMEELNHESKIIRIPLESIAAGVYNVLVVHSGEVHTLRFEKTAE